MPTESPTEGETLSAVELLFLSVEKRVGRIADAAEETTRQITRVADALECIASKFELLTESVETENGKPYGTLRVHDARPNWLSMMKSGSDHDT